MKSLFRVRSGLHIVTLDKFVPVPTQDNITLYAVKEDQVSTEKLACRSYVVAVTIHPYKRLSPRRLVECRHGPKSRAWNCCAEDGARQQLRIGYIRILSVPVDVNLVLFSPPLRGR